MKFVFQTIVYNRYYRELGFGFTFHTGFVIDIELFWFGIILDWHDSRSER